MMVDFTDELIGLHVNGAARLVEDEELRARAPRPPGGDRARASRQRVGGGHRRGGLHPLPQAHPADGAGRRPPAPGAPTTCAARAATTSASPRPARRAAAAQAEIDAAQADPRETVRAGAGAPPGSDLRSARLEQARARDGRSRRPPPAAAVAHRRAAGGQRLPAGSRRGRDGELTLVDGGWAIDASRDVLGRLLGELGLATGDVRRFLVTHVHRDHYSQAIALRREHGARVALGAGERDSLEVIQPPRRRAGRPGRGAGPGGGARRSPTEVRRVGRRRRGAADRGLRRPRRVARRRAGAGGRRAARWWCARRRATRAGTSCSSTRPTADARDALRRRPRPAPHHALDRLRARRAAGGAHPLPDLARGPARRAGPAAAARPRPGGAERPRPRRRAGRPPRPAPRRDRRGGRGRRLHRPRGRRRHPVDAPRVPPRRAWRRSTACSRCWRPTPTSRSSPRRDGCARDRRAGRPGSTTTRRPDRQPPGHVPSAALAARRRVRRYGGWSSRHNGAGPRSWRRPA